MDNRNEVDVQNVDNESSDVVTGCLQNSVVLREILEHFSSPELRQLSFVNKRWKAEAQSLMRKRGQFTAHVRCPGLNQYHPHEEVEAFISDLKQMNPVPFSGISIDINFESLYNESPAEDLDPFQDVVLDQPFLKIISVNLDQSWKWAHSLAHPGLLLANKLLQGCSGVLEELELNSDDGRKGLIEKVVQDIIFPQLKILKLRAHFQRSEEPGNEAYLKKMLSRAPNLKVLHSNGSMDLLSRVMEGTSVVPVYRCVIQAPFEETSEDIIRAMKFESVELKYTGRRFNLERFNRITPTLLQESCKTTLCSMWLDAVLALPLMSYGIRFKRVKFLNIEMDYDHLEHTEPRILNIVKNLDFTHLFPKLNNVRIFFEYWNVPQLLPGHVNVFIEQANAVLREPMLDRAVRVKQLLLICWKPSSAAAQFYVDMFPNIEKLEIVQYAGAYAPIPSGSIWNWLDLKELEVEGSALPTRGNLDSIFCGIFPEEVEELRLKDDEYLKKVNIVPVMPAVTCLKNLRTLSIHHKHHPGDSFGDDGDATFIFSKVTALLVFKRQPALTVSLRISSRAGYAVPPAMSHLEAYMSIISERIEDVNWQFGG